MQPEEKFEDTQTPDLFNPSADLPSEGVYADTGQQELQYIGELVLPRPIPVELTVEIDGWDYVYKLDRRTKA